MKTRRLGATGPEISRVGFGTWGVGGPWKFGWGPVDDDMSIEAIRRAIECGVTWVDTAAVYGVGHSEEVVGRALDAVSGRRRRARLHQVRPHWEGRPDGEIGSDLRPASIRRECEASLRRLGVERIDLYQVHWPDV